MDSDAMPASILCELHSIVLAFGAKGNSVHASHAHLCSLKAIPTFWDRNVLLVELKWTLAGTWEWTTILIISWESCILIARRIKFMKKLSLPTLIEILEERMPKGSLHWSPYLTTYVCGWYMYVCICGCDDVDVFGLWSRHLYYASQWSIHIFFRFEEMKKRQMRQYKLALKEAKQKRLSEKMDRFRMKSSSFVSKDREVIQFQLLYLGSSCKKPNIGLSLVVGSSPS